MIQRIFNSSSAFLAKLQSTTLDSAGSSFDFRVANHLDDIFHGLVGSDAIVAVKTDDVPVNAFSDIRVLDSPLGVHDRKDFVLASANVIDGFEHGLDHLDDFIRLLFILWVSTAKPPSGMFMISLNERSSLKPRFSRAIERRHEHGAVDGSAVQGHVTRGTAADLKKRDIFLRIQTVLS